MRDLNRIIRSVGMVAVLLVISAVGAHSQTTFTVNLTTDTGDLTCDATCELRGAIDDANNTAGDDTIVFDAGVFGTTTQTITLIDAGGDLDITTNITITGPGARLLIVNQTTANERVFDQTAGDTSTISGMTISGGDENAEGSGLRNQGTMTLISVRITGNVADGDGGGVANLSTLTIRDSLIDGNSTSGANNNGGGIYNTAAGDTITISNTTITNNSTGAAGTDGGGIYNNTGATLNINNATISHNTAADSGGGIFDLATVNIRNTIVSNNVSTADATDEDLAGSFTSSATAGGSNLIRIIGDATGFTDGVNGDDIGTAGTPVEPSLGTLQNNFGPTNTRALTTGSPAIDTGNNCVVTSTCTANNPPALTLDQRGIAFPRQVGTNVDKGGYEFNGLAPTAAGISIGGRVTTNIGSGVSRVVVTLTGGNLPEPRQAMTNGFGYYTFEDIPAGQTYIVSVSSKQYVFANPIQVFNADDNVSGVDFIAESQGIRNTRLKW